MSFSKKNVLMNFQIEKSTIYPDISVLSDEQFSNFREEYDYYKKVITQALDESIEQSDIGRVKEVEFRELTFSILPGYATLKAVVVIDVSKEYINKIEKECKWYHFFKTMLGTNFRMKSPYTKHKAEFIVL